jgi:hypothetical protein
MLSRIGGRWSLLVVTTLGYPSRFNELLPMISIKSIVLVEITQLGVTGDAAKHPHHAPATSEFPRSDRQKMEVNPVTIPQPERLATGDALETTASEPTGRGVPVSGQLARLARDTVKGAGRARLAIHGCPLGPGNPVANLYTDNGWPVWWCDLSSAPAVAAAENRTAMLTVIGPAAGPQTVTVLLAGRLELLGSGWERGRRVGAVALAPERVLVVTYAPGRPAVTSQVPVSDYADADPDALAARAQQLAGHTNAAHGRELRWFVAARAGIPADQVAAAWLTGLDARGAELHWIGPAGAHTMTARFPRQARTATELAMLLRAQLAGAEREGTGNGR